jgi:hypothetical protein
MVTVADMTVEELKRFVLELIEEQRRAGRFSTLDEFDAELEAEDLLYRRNIEDVIADMEKYRWTPPPGSPTPAEMIREDRDTH